MAEMDLGNAGPCKRRTTCYIDLVFKVFPDAKVVQSHRDSVGTIPALTSVYSSMMYKRPAAG